MKQIKHLLFILLLLFLTSNFLGCSPKKWHYLPQSKADERTIYVVAHGWHTGIVIDFKDLDKRFDSIKKDLGKSPYYEFGWGDKAYYQAKEVTSGLTLQAALWPTPSVMHVVAVPYEPKAYFSNAKVLKVKSSQEGLMHLVNYLFKTFKQDAHHAFIPTKQGLYGKSHFYDAKGSFYLMNTCNSYTIQALQKAGLPVSTFLTIRAASVISQTQEAIKNYPAKITKD